MNSSPGDQINLYQEHFAKCWLRRWILPTKRTWGWRWWWWTWETVKDSSTCRAVMWRMYFPGHWWAPVWCPRITTSSLWVNSRPKDQWCPTITRWYTAQANWRRATCRSLFLVSASTTPTGPVRSRFLRSYSTRRNVRSLVPRCWAVLRWPRSCWTSLTTFDLFGFISVLIDIIRTELIINWINAQLIRFNKLVNEYRRDSLWENRVLMIMVELSNCFTDSGRSTLLCRVFNSLLESSIEEYVWKQTTRHSYLIVHC